MTTVPRDEIDPRVTRTHHLVLDAASDLLAQEGYGGFTVDGVAARSGVAKTTIYRHWPTRFDLLSATIACYSDCAPTPDTGTLRGDVDVLLKQLAVELAEAPWSRSMPGMLDAAERDPELATAQLAIFDAHGAALREVLVRAQARGELRAHVDLEVAFAALAGPMFFRRLMLRQRTTSHQVDELIEQVLTGIAGTAVAPAPSEELAAELG
jgi:AcrR family transcriptional regulator